MASIITDPKKVDEKNLKFAKIQPRGTFYFVATSYGGKPLTIRTPALITPTGVQAQGARSFLDLELDVNTNTAHQDLYDMFKGIDDRCIDESIANMDKWFKGDVDEQFIEDQFKSPITTGWGNEPSEMRVELMSENPEDIMDSQGNIISASDVTPLSSVVVTLQLLGVWVSKDFLGCHWRALSLVANLDHESKGRRRASSPRRAASPLPPVTARGRGGAPKQEEKQREEEVSASRRRRIESMLERFKSEANAPAAPPEDEGQAYYSDDGHHGRYSDDEYYGSSSRRSSSTPRRDDRYSDDDERRYSDEEDDGYYSGRDRDDYYSSSSRHGERREDRYSDDDDYYSDDDYSR